MKRVNIMDKTEDNSILPSYKSTGDIALKNQKTLRRLVGMLGILLPILIWLFLKIANNFDLILPSISHYYFTRSASVFEIIVSLLAVFLMIYKGEKIIDYILSTLAGVAALLMLIFPTNNLKDYLGGKFNAVAVTQISESSFRPKFHYICASIFLLSLASMALCLFTKTNKNRKKTKEKKIRNGFYIICGSVMLLALGTALLGFTGVISSDFYDAHNMTFWMEVVSVEAFGIAWMVKGGVVFEDK